MTTGVVLCGFGEPAEPDHEAVVAYLERIFRRNAQLESPATDADARARARQLAERRAPSLLEEYEAIGGSPLNAQAAAQAEALAGELADRGHDVETYVGMQFIEPFVEEAVAAAGADAVDHLVGLPLYPLCGPSTSVAALDQLERAIEASGATMTFDAVAGWHRHPGYLRLRAANVASFVAELAIDLTDPATAFACSAHGTPLRYLEAGSRYREYVVEHCDALGVELGVDDPTIGYQNHANRGVPWTQPDVEDVISALDADRVVVEPVSFLHEQSETLAELDDDLREVAERRGLEFHRVPIPHDDPDLASVLADLVEPLLGHRVEDLELGPCECRTAPGTVCLNAPPAAGR